MFRKFIDKYIGKELLFDFHKKEGAIVPIWSTVNAVEGVNELDDDDSLRRLFVFIISRNHLTGLEKYPAAIRPTARGSGSGPVLMVRYVFKNQGMIKMVLPLEQYAIEPIHNNQSDERRSNMAIYLVQHGKSLSKEQDPDLRLMLIGHLPFMEKLTGLLTTGSADITPFKFQNSGIVCLDRDPDSSKWFIKWSLMPKIGDGYEPYNDT